MVGIPLFAIMFSAIGDKMAKRFHALGNRLEKKVSAVSRMHFHPKLIKI